MRSPVGSNPVRRCACVALLTSDHDATSGLSSQPIGGRKGPGRGVSWNCTHGKKSAGRHSRVRLMASSSTSTKEPALTVSCQHSSLCDAAAGVKVAQVQRGRELRKLVLLRHLRQEL